MNTTYVLLKPDAVVLRECDAILDWLERRGFYATDWSTVFATDVVCDALWRRAWPHLSGARRQIQLDFMQMSSCLFVELETRFLDATQRLAEIKGASKPEDRLPNTLRRHFAHNNSVLNRVHSPDSEPDLVSDLEMLRKLATRYPSRAEAVAAVYAAGGCSPLSVDQAGRARPSSGESTFSEGTAEIDSAASARWADLVLRAHEFGGSEDLDGRPPSCGSTVRAISAKEANR